MLNTYYYAIKNYVIQQLKWNINKFEIKSTYINLQKSIIITALLIKLW